MFRPQSFQCLEAATDATGKVTGWKHCVVGEGDLLLITGIKIPYYGVPNQHIERRGVSHGIRLKHWRAVGARVQHVRDRELGRPDGGGRRHGPDRVPLPAHGRSPRRRASASRPWRRCATGRPSGRTAARSASRSPSARARSAPAWSRSRSTARPARSACTRCGPRSTAASSSRRARPRPTSRARSSTASPACCTSA